jgi:hypothetical protein
MKEIVKKTFVRESLLGKFVHLHAVMATSTVKVIRKGQRNWMQKTIENARLCPCVIWIVISQRTKWVFYLELFPEKIEILNKYSLLATVEKTLLSNRNLYPPMMRSESKLDTKFEQLVQSFHRLKSTHLWIMSTSKCVTWEIRMSMDMKIFPICISYL